MSVRLSCAVLLAATLASRPLQAEPIFFDGFETLAVGCSDPFIAPPQWFLHPVSWTTAWSSPDGIPQAAYPNSVGFPVPIGANKDEIRAIQFVPLPDQIVTITWDMAQNNPIQGYEARPAETMFVAISECAGDLRPIDPGSADPMLRDRCRKRAGGATMYFSTRAADLDNPQVCPLEAGRTYYLSVAPLDPSDGLVFGEHTCNDAIETTVHGCDVQAIHRGN